MSYIVYHTESTVIPRMKRGYGSQSFATERAAKAALTRALRDGKIDGVRADYSIADSRTFHDSIEKEVERVNLMSGNKYMERVNTPISCSPASETYWSM